MTIKQYTRRMALFVAILLASSVSQALAQSEIQWRGSDPDNDITSGDFNVASNWDLTPLGNGPFVPTGQWDEEAIISNGGTATVSNTVPTQGYLTVSNGTLAVSSTGSITIDAVQKTQLDPPEDQEFTTGVATFGASGTLDLASSGSFSAEVLSLNGSYNQEITSGGSTAIQVGQAANLGGSLEANFAGFTPSLTDTWTLLEASTVSGSFSAVTVTGGPALPYGAFYDTRTVAAGGGRVAEELYVTTDLILEVDADNGGVATIKSAATGIPINIDAYRIRSAQGGLDPTSWTSLDDADGPGDNNDGGWRESPGTANQLAELNQDSSTTIDTTGVSLGSIFAFDPPPAFRAPVSDLVFDYTTTDGEEKQGLVEISYINDLVLTVDPSNGEARLSNPSGFAVEIEAYQITSSMDSLVPGGWTSLDDADGAGDNNDGGWRESPATTSFIAELNEDSVLSVSPGGNLLGAIYDFASDERDLVFSFLLAGETELLQGTVVYDTISLSDPLGDFNGDGIVDGADYTVWRDNEGGSETAFANGSGSGNGTVDQDDYNLWRSNFGNSYASSILADGNAAVPEPSAIAIVVGGCVAMLIARRRG